MKQLLIWLLVFSSLSNPRLSKLANFSQTAKELKSLAGTWRPISTENNGYKASEADLKGSHLIRDANGNWLMRRGDKIVVWWAVKKIDATKVPKTINIEVTAGPYKGIVCLGIYDLNGDTLNI